MRPMRSTVCAVLAAAVAATLITSAPNALAQTYPTRPIKIIQGFAVGGNTDTIARIVGAEIGKTLGQGVVVEAVLGASGRIAAEQVARATPDGYLLLVISGGHTAVGALHQNLKFDPVDSFAPIAIVQDIEFIFSTRADSRHKTLAGLIDAAKANPGKVSFGAASTGTTPHLTGELFGIMTGTQLLFVPYKGDAAAFTAVLTNEVDFAVTTPGTALGQIRGGGARALASTGLARMPVLPDVPTAQEAGVPGFEVRSWVGFVTTAGTPRPIIDRLYDAIKRAVENPEVRQKILAFGGGVIINSPDEMRARMTSDLNRWKRVIKERNIKEP